MRFGRCGNLHRLKSGRLIAMTSQQSRRLYALSSRKSMERGVERAKKYSTRQKIILRVRGAKPYKKLGIMGIQQFLDHMDDLCSEFTMCETLYHEQKELNAIIECGGQMWCSDGVIPVALKKEFIWTIFGSPKTPTYREDENLDIIVYTYSPIMDKHVEIGKIDGPKTIAEKLAKEIEDDLPVTCKQPRRSSL